MSSETTYSLASGESAEYNFRSDDTFLGVRNINGHTVTVAHVVAGEVDTIENGTLTANADRVLELYTGARLRVTVSGGTGDALIVLAPRHSSVH